MFSESDLLPISALQHLAFCERQCALIHIEQAWAENRLTAEGRLMHDRVHGQEAETRGDIRTVRGLRIRSLELGISGIADMVEFHRSEEGMTLPGVRGAWVVFPVEYKRGKPKTDRCDEIQLCAQALCLEEMMFAKIPAGALYYGSQHKRQEVVFDEELRNITGTMAARLHQLIQKNITPPAHHDKRCGHCSLFDICMPSAGKCRRIQKYLEEAFNSFDEVTSA
jgi:CRISPR-associated exonuclease Cas4